MKQEKKKLLMLVVGFSLLLNACGKKEEKQEETQSAPAPAPAPTASTPAAPVPPPQPSLPAKFEAASPGTPLKSNTLKASLDLMAKNLKPIQSAKINLESTYDYIVTNIDSDTPTFAKGPNEKVSSSPYAYPDYDLFVERYSGGLSISRSGNYIEPSITYYFVPELEIGGLKLYSTESVALFRANSNALEVLKVNYTTATPAIQRFKITELYNVRTDNKGGTSSKWIIFQQNYATSVEKRKKTN